MKTFTSKLFLLFACLLCAVATQAQDPFRSHRYDVFKVLPVSNDNIVFIGNSITNMHEWWEAFGGEHKILNRGVWGTFINETVQHIEAVAAGKPAKVFMMVGTNDLGKNGNRDIDAIISHTRTIVERLQKVSPTTEIYIQGILPSVYNRIIEQLIETNDRLKQLCSEMGITYIDLWDDLISLTTDQTHTLDGLHMKASGYAIWTKKIEEHVGAKSVYPDNCTEVQSTNGITIASYGMRATIFSTLPVNEGDILIIGDEMIHGGEWHELLQSDKVKSRGAGWGYTGPWLDVIAKEIPLILNNRAGSCKPSKIFLYAGAGDINGTSSLATIKQNYANIISDIKSRAPEAKIYLMSLQPTNNASTNTGRVVPFNNELRAMAESDSKLEYVDIYSDFVSNNIGNSRYFSGNYLKGMGYVKVAQKIAEAIGDDAIKAITDEEAERNYRNFELRTTLGNKIATTGRLVEGEGVGEYSNASLEPLRAVTEKAYSLLANGGTEAEFEAAGEEITEAVNNTLENINMPQTSNGGNDVWYKLYTPNRGSRYLTSQGIGTQLIGDTDDNNTKCQWKFTKRNDGSLNIINRNDGSYLNPDAQHNTAISTAPTEPAKGWELSYSDTPGTFIIYSGTTELNQTESGLGWKVYNWSKNADGRDRSDKGCQYRIELVTEEPDIEEDIENVIEFSFKRGTTLDNSTVIALDKSGRNSKLNASIAATGANGWLTSNSASADSILCVNINTKATAKSSPITYTLEIEGIDNCYEITDITFDAVALNSTGQWQGATETRHCNFVCSYGENSESLAELATKTDESIMIANGEVKQVSFDTEAITPTNNRLTIRMELYKGTNNLGCFYGLTGITLKGRYINSGETVIEKTELATDDGVKDVEIYDLQGRRLNGITGKGIYIVNGNKVLVK